VAFEKLVVHTADLEVTMVRLNSSHVHSAIVRCPSVCLSVTSRCSVEVGEWIELSCSTERNLSWFRCVCRPVSAAIASDLVSKFERRRVPCCSLGRADRRKCCQLSSAVTRLLCPRRPNGAFWNSAIRPPVCPMAQLPAL